MPYLYFYRRGQEMLHLDLTQVIRPDEPLIVGSERGNYVVPAPGIAPVQFQIALEGGGYRLDDLSGERTKVDGAPVKSAMLAEGSNIQLGPFNLLYSRDEHETSEGSSSRTLADAFERPELPKALWITAQRRSGGAPVRIDLGARAVIGSGKDCQLRLDGDTVSARHAELVREDGAVLVRDLESTNGTWLGAVRAYSFYPPLGLRFRVGDWDVWLSSADDRRANSGRPVMTAGGLVTNDPGMLALLQQADAAAKTDCAVLILGETGTGKELFAQAIHERSRRAGQKMISFNCGLGRSAENMATQLFGHTKGAFTGADQAQPGTFGAADGGTVFLDELEAMPRELQPTLLRAIGEGEIHPLGAAEPRRVNVRVIAAAHQDLAAAIRKGEFREDLYWRFAVATFELPPLRLRKGDIPLLRDHFAAKLWTGGQPITFTEAAHNKLMGHDWPGNVRELWNVVNRALLLTDGIVCDASAIVFDERFETPERPKLHLVQPEPPAGAIDTRGKTLAEIEAAALEEVMLSVNGNRTDACRQLGIDHKRLLRMLKEYNLERVGLKGDSDGD